MHLDTRTKLFLVLAALFVTCLVVGDIIGGKLTDLTLLGYSTTISVGMIPFPIVFVLTDLINEFYGKRAARTVTLVGAGMASLTIVILAVAAQIPFAAMTQAPEWGGVREDAFNNVLAGSFRILISSVVAYLISQLVDIGVFHLIRTRTRGKLLWFRATGSTIVSQGIDTVVIQYLAWVGLMPVMQIAKMIVASYGIKVLIAVLVTPIVYLGHGLIERGLHIHPTPIDR